MAPVWEHLDSLGIPTGDAWLEGPQRSIVREVNSSTSPGQTTEEYEALPSEKVTGESVSASETVPETVPAEAGTQISVPIEAAEADKSSAEGEPAEPLTHDSNEDSRSLVGTDIIPQSAVLVGSVDEEEELTSEEATTPSTTFVALSPYEKWPLHPMPPATDRNIRHVQQGLVEILRIEGPMIARQAYLRYQQATGGQRVGKSLQSTFNVATSRALRDGSIARLDDGIPGVVNATLYTPGKDPVCIRQLGPRTLFEVPQSELLAIMELLIANGVHEWDLDRELLNALGLKRMTARTSEYLRECRSYTWRV